jgi:predicted site-specific integrase-resolvase
MKIKNSIINEEKDCNLHLESKREKFRRITEARTGNLIRQIRVLTNCANRLNYNYTQEEVDQIFKAINNALEESRKAFNPQLSSLKFPPIDEE